MDNYNKGSDQDKFIDNLLQEISGYSEEDLLDEFEAACNLDVPQLNSEPSPDEFEKIWARVLEEQAVAQDSDERKEPADLGHHKIIKGRFGWKRLAAIGLTACLMAGSGCMVAMGEKSYFYRERRDVLLGDNSVFNNDMNKVAANGEEEAYALIQKDLKIRPLKLGYLPTNIEFSKIGAGEGFIYIRFLYEDNFIYLIQSKYEREVSYSYKSDSKSEEGSEVYNKWLRMKLKIRKETLTNNNTAFDTNIVIDGACYRLLGAVEETVFKKIVQGLSF